MISLFVVLLLLLFFSFWHRTVFEVKQAGLADVLQLGACLAHLRLLEAAVAARLPSEDGERPCANLALLACNRKKEEIKKIKVKRIGTPLPEETNRTAPWSSAHTGCRQGMSGTEWGTRPSPSSATKGIIRSGLILGAERMLAVAACYLLPWPVSPGPFAAFPVNPPFVLHPLSFHYFLFLSFFSFFLFRQAAHSTWRFMVLVFFEEAAMAGRALCRERWLQCAGLVLFFFFFLLDFFC